MVLAPAHSMLTLVVGPYELAPHVVYARFVTAEVFVVAHGAEDGPSLFGDTDRTNVKEKDATDDA